MPNVHPEQEWWTVAQIADACLPDLPTTRRGVEALAQRMRWREQPGFARQRAARGGGWEYSWRLFPSTAQRKLLGGSAPKKAPRQGRDEAWRWFDGLPDHVKAKARARLSIIHTVEGLEPVAGSKHLAVVMVAKSHAVSQRSIWHWMAMIDGVRPDDRLPYLAPRHLAAAKTADRQKDCSPEFFDAIKSDYLRLEAPPFTDCYRRAVRIAAAQGWDTLPERTMRRRLDMAVSGPMQVLARKGVDAVKRMFPAQVRDKTAMVAMEAVNADFHKFDVFVRWPAPKGETPQILRPQMVAFQDIYSGRVLAWRIDVSANSTAVMLAAGELIENWGIPEHVLLDNGREFAAKSITGGSATRFRFKVREDDLPGLFTGLGCKIHWATPYSGQSKPIERAFRDMCQAIAKDPRLAGAYTGNRPDAKPENYGSRAIELEEFLRVLSEGIEEHNTRQGRRSEVAYGRSFAEVFDESYASAPIRKATAEQRRLWLLGAEGLRADTHSGAISFQGNEFWADWMHEVAGKRLIVRFDPANLWDGLHVYSAQNAYLGHAPCRVKAGFFSIDEARMQARARADWMKKEKAALEAHRRFKASELGQMLDDLPASPTPSVEAKVVKPTFGGRGKPQQVPERPMPSAQPSLGDFEAAKAVVIADLDDRRAVKTGVVAEETSLQRFKRALELERALERNEAVTVDQQRWLSGFQMTPEYRAHRATWDDFGDVIFG